MIRSGTRLRAVRTALKGCTDEQLLTAREWLFALARQDGPPSRLFRSFGAVVEAEVGIRASQVRELERLYFKKP